MSEIFQKEKNCLDSSNDNCRDLEDILIDGIGGPAYILYEMFCYARIEINGPKGSVMVECPAEAPWVGFEERINELHRDAIKIAEQTGSTLEDVSEKLFALDSWTWNEYAFRSPIWMRDSREISIEQAKKIGGLEWLTGSSSEKRFRPIVEKE